ncbi:uncharacterized protein LOC122757410 [Drosophila mojavensis]|uniref:uncharacterized protein LOC122757410 n=1 Tax=Drosophila mojavensis TaxID=7230 RepID=UPI001CD0B1BB|nr:uncharacterized protein LOC122757410 [Drosophila mojavensis]
MIAQYIEGHQSSWDELLPEITLAVNSSVADSTGFTHAFLMLGRDNRLPAALYDEVTPGSATKEIQPEAKEDRMREAFDIVRSNLHRASGDQGRHYNLRQRDWRPALGSEVLLRQHQLSNAAEGFAAQSRQIHLSQCGVPEKGRRTQEEGGQHSAAETISPSRSGGDRSDLGRRSSG